MATKQNIIKITVVFISSILFLSGCYTRVERTKYIYSELKLYNLNSGERIILEIDDVYEQSGKLFGKLKNGDELNGDFYLSGPNPIRKPYYIEYKAMEMNDFVNKKVGDDKKEYNYSENFIKTSFPELYGYTKNTNISPIGTAVVVSENNFLIEIVFYKIDFQRRIGDGIAKDNKGNIYRVYLNSEYIYQ